MVTKPVDLESFVVDYLLGLKKDGVVIKEIPVEILNSLILLTVSGNINKSSNEWWTVSCKRVGMVQWKIGHYHYGSLYFFLRINGMYLIKVNPRKKKIK